MTDIANNGRLQLKAPPSAVFAIVGTVFFWGLSFVSSKTVLNAGFPPLSIAFFRFLIASLILIPLQRRLDPGLRIRREDRLALILSGAFGITIYFFFETTGLRLTTASNAALIIAAIPVFTLAAEVLIYRSPLRWQQAVGILLSLAGVYFIVRSPAVRPREQFLGNLLMLGACLSWVGYIMFSRNLRRRISGIGLLACQSLIGTLFLLPLALLESRQWILGDPRVWLNILYLGLFCSALAYSLYLYALANLSVVAVSSFINLVPLISVLGSVVILGERIAFHQILGGSIVVAGVFLVNRWQNK